VTPKNPYEVLGVSKDASEDEIRKIYRQLALQYHPDRNPGNKVSEDKFREITEAFAILSDPQKRFQYDSRDIFNRVGRHGFRAAPWTHTNTRNPFIDDIFAYQETVSSIQEEAGEDITETIYISLLEAVRGCQKKIAVNSPKIRFNCENCAGTGAAPGSKRILCMACGGKGRIPDYRVGVGPRLKTCSACKGAGFKPLSKCSVCKGVGKIHKHREVVVKVPAGINDGQRLRLAGCGSPGSPPGDLYVNINVKLDDRFVRQGQDILTTTKISFVDAIQGCSTNVQSLDGHEIQILVPPETQQGTIIKVIGSGIAGILGLKQGDLLVQIYIEMPQNMTTRAELLLKELAEELSKSKLK
jgi:molecular chaperone DnaJ